MVQMPWYDIFLVSFPETIILLCLGLALIGYELKKNIRIILITALIFSFISYGLQFTHIPFGVHSIVQLVILIFLVKYLLKINFSVTTLVILLGMLILMIFEAANIFLITTFANLNYETISSSPVLFILIPYIHFTFLTFLIIFFKKKNITLLPLFSKLKLKKLNMNLILTMIILFLVIILIPIYFGSTFTRIGPFNSKQGLQISTTLIFVLIFIIGFTIKKLINVTQTQAIIETQEVYLKNMQELYTGLRSQRHDFANQIQVIHGLLGLNKIEAAKEFSTELCQHLANLNKVVQVDDPVLAALLQAKMSFADNNQVNFTLNVQSKLDKLSLTPLEFTKITGNLLDNAFDAAMQLPEENRQVGFALKCIDDFYLIEVTNTGHPIPPNMLKQIFTGGVTSKKEHTGLGLSIVKKLVEKYKGNIKVSSDESGTVFTVTLPIK